MLFLVGRQIMSKMSRPEEFQNPMDSGWANSRRIRDLEEQIDSLRESIEKISFSASSTPSPAPLFDEASPSFASNFIGFAAEQNGLAHHHRGAPSQNDPSNKLLLAARVRNRIRQRRKRETLFNAEIFADPAWDMLLDLYAAELEGSDVSVSSLCIAAAVPTTTALRWIKLLSDQGWLVRQQDPNDGRRINMRLSDESRSRLNRYFEALQN
jgi:DNA-binding MarR family transcriptional regulator